MFAASAPANALTSSQKSQAAQVARQTENINTTSGYVNVTSATLAQHGLDPAHIAYVKKTIQQYHLRYGLTSSSPRRIIPKTAPSLSPSIAVGPNTGLWVTLARYTKQWVMLYYGKESEVGWRHMEYRHNWGGGWGDYWARRAIQIAVHRDQWYYVQGNGRYGYDKWFTTTVPFEKWSVLMVRG